MYGLINTALKDMICAQFGEEKWDQVLLASGVPQDSFLTMRRYDDDVTFALAGAAAETLGAPVEDCLEMFGEYWVLETASKSYAPLMDAAGDNMVDFLRNLNALHDRITSTFLDYIPPEFEIEHAQGDQYEITYRSQRQGLTPFVNGLLKGLGKRFGSQLTVLEQVSQSVAKGEQTLFKVKILPA